MSHRIGLAQMLVEGGKPDANMGRAVAMVKRAAAEGCRLVVLPECLDLGWTDPSARELAEPIPGARSATLVDAATEHKLYIAAGIVERDGDHLYNAALLIAPTGEILLHHRKINELDIGRELYTTGTSVTVTDTDLGRIGIAICADNYWDSRAIGHVLCRMGAQLILSPSAWAVPADHDNERDPYGDDWVPSYTELAQLYDATVIGVSNVGMITAGPWQGRPCIGCSLAIGPGGTILARGRYGVDAEDLIIIDIEPQQPIATGTDLITALRQRGYDGG
jgi:predicted amidohydrolase